VEKGRKLLAAGDDVGALECAKDALALYPEDSPAAALARAAAPVDAPEKHVSEKTNVVDDLTAELVRARSEGQLQKALSICRRILEINPNDETVRIAADEIDREIKGKEVEQLLTTAVAYAKEGDFELSTKIATKIGKIDPENPKLKDLQQYLREETTRREAENSRREADALVATAQEHLALGNLEEAIAAAEEALHFHSANAVAREIRDGASKLLAARQPVPPPPAPAPAARPASVEELVSDPDPEPEPIPAPPVARPAPPAAPSAPKAPAPKPPAPRPPVTTPAAAPPAPTPAPRPASPTPVPAVTAPPAPRVPAPAPAKVAASTSLATPPPVAGNSPAAGAAGGNSSSEVAALLETALNHFLMSENKKAKKAVEKVLALDPGNRKAQELIKILGSL
jgi:tetratricopeptide (TPR) repeat protein